MVHGSKRQGEGTLTEGKVMIATAKPDAIVVFGVSGPVAHSAANSRNPDVVARIRAKHLGSA